MRAFWKPNFKELLKYILVKLKVTQSNLGECDWSILVNISLFIEFGTC